MLVTFICLPAVAADLIACLMVFRVAFPGVTPVHLHETMARCLNLHHVENVLLFCVAEAVQRHLAAEQEGRMAVSKDLVAAQREMEGLVQRNHQLEHVNASMGEEALRVQVEQEEMRARFEAQSAELTSLKVSTSLSEHAFQTSCVASFQ